MWWQSISATASHFLLMFRFPQPLYQLLDEYRADLSACRRIHFILLSPLDSHRVIVLSRLLIFLKRWIIRQIKHHSLWQEYSRLKLLLHTIHKHLGVSEVFVISQSWQDFWSGEVVIPEGLVSREEINEVTKGRLVRLTQLLIRSVVEHEG